MAPKNRISGHISPSSMHDDESLKPYPQDSAANPSGVEQFIGGFKGRIAERPEIAIAIGISVGVALGFLVKRR